MKNQCAWQCINATTSNKSLYNLLVGNLWRVSAETDQPAVFKPLADETDELYGKVITTSPINEITLSDDLLKISTDNTHYIFKRVDVCSTCGKAKGIWRIDPYHEEIDGEIRFVCLCEDCYEFDLGSI